MLSSPPCCPQHWRCGPAVLRGPLLPYPCANPPGCTSKHQMAKRDECLACGLSSPQEEGGSMPSQPLFPPLLLLPLGQLFASGVESQEGRGRLCALRSRSQEIGAGTPPPHRGCTENTRMPCTGQRVKFTAQGEGDEWGKQGFRAWEQPGQSPRALPVSSSRSDDALWFPKEHD